MKKIMPLVMSFFAMVWMTAWLYEDVDGGKVTVSLGKVTITPYQAVSAQTDGAPFVTADGTDLRETNEKICALSQDLMCFMGGPAEWGDMIFLYIPGRPDLTGYWTVRDTMAATIYRDGQEVPLAKHVDLLIDASGKWQGRALLVKKQKPLRRLVPPGIQSWDEKIGKWMGHKCGAKIVSGT